MRISSHSEYNTLRGPVATKVSVMSTERLQAGCVASLFMRLAERLGSDEDSDMYFLFLVFITLLT